MIAIVSDIVLRRASACALTGLLVTLTAALRADDSAVIRLRAGQAVTIGGEIRLRGEGRSNDDFRSDRSADQTFLGLRSRFDVDFTVREDLQAFLRIQDTRRFGQFGTVDATASTFLKEGYFHWKGIGGTSMGLKLGRQAINLADQRLIGAFDWNNTGRSFDAIRLDAKPAGVPIWAFTSLTAAAAQGDEFHNDQSFHGLVVSPQNSAWKTLDLYALALVDHRNLGTGGGDQKVYTAGGHFVFPIGGRLTATLQGNSQIGDDGRNEIDAWSAHANIAWATGRSFIKTFDVEYNHASGDDDRGDRTTRTFNQLFPTNHDKYGYADHAGFRNLQNIKVGLRGDLKKDRLSWGLDGHWFRRDEAADDFYTVAGAARGYGTAGGTDLGRELDATLWYKPNPRLGIMTGYSRFFLGDAVEAAIRNAGGNPRDADFGYIQATVTF